jgi:hypothetical protein
MTNTDTKAAYKKYLYSLIVSLIFVELNLCYISCYFSRRVGNSPIIFSGHKNK